MTSYYTATVQGSLRYPITVDGNKNFTNEANARKAARFWVDRAAKVRLPAPCAPRVDLSGGPEGARSRTVLLNDVYGSTIITDPYTEYLVSTIVEWWGLGGNLLLTEAGTVVVTIAIEEHPLISGFGSDDVTNTSLDTHLRQQAHSSR